MMIPEADLPIEAPRPLDTWRELRTPVEWLKLACRWPSLGKEQATEPRTVVLLPGFGASPITLVALERALERQGHTVFDWGLGRNGGDVPEMMPKIVERFEELAKLSGEPIVAIGWSLGGYLAREAARDRQHLVRQVITLASPVVGGPSYTTVAKWYRSRGVDLPELRATVAQRYEVPLEVPVLSIYSKSDGVVAWQACIDEWSPDVRHVEVDATHLAMGASPEVLDIVLEELRQ